MNPRDASLLVLLAALFGSSFLFMRIAVPDVGPFMVAGVRVAIAAVVLLTVLLLRREAGRLKEHAGPLALVGLIFVATPFTLISAAELQLTASLASVLNALVPAWGIVVAAVAYSQPITGKRLLGAATGLVGVALAVGLGTLGLSWATALAVGAMLLATLCYAVGSVLAARLLAGVPPQVTTTGLMLSATAWLAVPMALTWPDSRPETDTIWSLITLGVLCTGFAFGIFFVLLARIGPVGSTSVTFLAPIFGILFGVVFLSERLSAGLFLGLLFVLAGVALITDTRLSTLRPRPAVPG